MKLKKYLAFSSLIALVFAGCKKELAVRDVEFDVLSYNTRQVQTNQFLLGDTINFNFTGNPDMITFYSGTPGGRYEFRNRKEAKGTPLLSFTTSHIQRNQNQPNSLAVLVSNDFAGIVNVTRWSLVTRDTLATTSNIKSATWTDITSRATMSPGDNANYISSGSINLEEFAASSKPVYVGFRYKANAGSIQPRWSIRDFLIKNKLDDGTEYTIANMNLPTAPFTNYGVNSYNPGWSMSRDNAVSPLVGWTITSAAPFTLDVPAAANLATAAQNADTWAIIGPINLRKVSADKGVVVKNIANRVTSYTIPKVNNYSSKATYKAVFEASNINADHQKEMIKELQLVIK
ncbi:DUF5017 domain-containing protein [Pedobacter sp. HDW13]|uniref:DUF5017 domain-containing protein n=1 Tax=Pedobacter sp. HDW13 TaxID=2714940 RepID=UPI00140D8BB1|nr:DUF5017 domain-containing protein [Pedobacter sp. HDW13]QIL38347.1 DUF5017 domain-containing protein [Pedobacter sp. HDW13]